MTLSGVFSPFFVPGFSFSSSQVGLNPFPARSKLLERLEGRGCPVSYCGLSYWVGPLLLQAGNHSSQCPGCGGLAPRHSMVPAHPLFQSVPPRSWCIFMAVSSSRDQGIEQSSAQALRTVLHFSCSGHAGARQWM